jgi:hypothetical protein
MRRVKNKPHNKVTTQNIHMSIPVQRRQPSSRHPSDAIWNSKRKGLAYPKYTAEGIDWVMANVQSFFETLQSMHRHSVAIGHLM